jgi:radical SAM protein with 4Fe4S-binding SPASM domain
MESSEEKFLFLLKTRGPQTAVTLSQQLGMTAVGARQHLTLLQQQGLVYPEDRRESVGRPKRYWCLTEKAQSRFPDTHAHLTLDLLNAIRTEFGEDGLDKLICRREADSLAHYRAATAVCGGIPEKIEKLTQLRSREGYMAQWQQQDDGSFLLIENHCPICAAAQLCQGFCRAELDIFRSVLGERVTVERIDHILAGARRCAYRISYKTEGV